MEDLGPIHRKYLIIRDGQFFISKLVLDSVCEDSYADVGDILWVRLAGATELATPTAFEVAGGRGRDWWLIKVDWLGKAELAGRWEERRHALAASAA
jgi:hypothetical protein